MLLLALADVEGGSQSLSEIDAVRLCRRARLPPPDRQTRTARASGRRRWLDLDWDAYALTVEIDGALHVLVRSWWADMDRQNEVVIGGGRAVLRFPAMACEASRARFRQNLEAS